MFHWDIYKKERGNFPFIIMLFSFLHMSKWQSRNENVLKIVSIIFSPLLRRHISLLSEGLSLFSKLYIWLSGLHEPRW